MSDIKDYTPPEERTLSEPIYAITWRCPIVSLNMNSNQIYSSNGLFRIRKIAHNYRVIGYKNGNDLYILGTEQLDGGYVDNGIFGGIGIAADYLSTANPPNFKMIQSGEWSNSNIRYDDMWNVGIRITEDRGYHPPLSLKDYTYIEKGNFDYFYSQYFKKGVIGSTLQLTPNPDTTAIARGIGDIVPGNVSTYFHYDPEIGMYPKAINAIFSALKKSVEFGNSNPPKDIYEYSPDGWIPLNKTSGAFYISFSNLIITESLSDAKKYIKDGTMPKNYTYDDPNNVVGGKPADDDDGDDQNNKSDGSNGSNHKDKIDINKPKDTAISLSNINIYLLTKEQLMAFISDMWNFSWSEIATNMMTGIYNNLIDNVQSIRVMPFAPAELGTVEAVNSIICGWWSHTATVQKLSTSTNGMNLKNAGNWEFKEVFGGWADYAPYTSIELYLPYYGTLNLDTNLFMGHTLKVEYVLDVLAGLITYFLLCDNTCVITVSAKCAADVPVSLSSGIDTFSDVLKNESRFISEAGNLRPVGMVTGSTSVATEKCINSCSESGMFYMPNKCHVRITRPAYTRASNYESRYGYPCYGAYKLNKLKGFTVVENYKSHYTKGIKKEEEDMIKNMMESGVYL